MDSYQQYLYYNKSSAKEQIKGNWNQIDRYRNFKFFYEFGKSADGSERNLDSSKQHTSREELLKEVAEVKVDEQNEKQINVLRL